MRTYDAHVVRTNGLQNTKASALNLPEEWIKTKKRHQPDSLAQSSDPEEGDAKGGTFKTSIYVGVSQRGSRFDKSRGYKSSGFIGVYPYHGDKFKASIYRGKKYDLGIFCLASDAALAYDSTATLMKSKTCGNRINFATVDEYYDARERELEKSGVVRDGRDCAEIIALIESKAKSVVAEAASDSFDDSAAEHDVRTSHCSKYCNLLEGRRISSPTLSAFATSKSKVITKHDSVIKTMSIPSGRISSLQMEPGLTKAAMLLKGPTRKKTNFSSKREYYDARESESKATGIAVDRSEIMSSIRAKVKEIGTKTKKKTMSRIGKTKEKLAMKSNEVAVSDSSYTMRPNSTFDAVRKSSEKSLKLSMIDRKKQVKVNDATNIDVPTAFNAIGTMQPVKREGSIAVEAAVAAFDTDARSKKLT